MPDAPRETPEKTARAEIERLVAERIHANPAMGREAILGEIFRETPALYARYRKETTLTTHGQTLAASYARSRGSFGVDHNGNVVTKSDLVGAVVLKRAAAVMSKSADVKTLDDAIGRVFADDPALYEMHRRASYA